MSFNAIREKKIFEKISGFTVLNRQVADAPASPEIHSVLKEPSLLTYIKYGRLWRFRP